MWVKNTKDILKVCWEDPGKIMSDIGVGHFGNARIYENHGFEVVGQNGGFWRPTMLVQHFGRVSLGETSKLFHMS